MSNLLGKVTLLPSGVVTIIGKQGKVKVYTQDEFYKSGLFMVWWASARYLLKL